MFHLLHYCCANQHKAHKTLEVNLATRRYKINSQLVSKLEQMCYLLWRGDGAMQCRIMVEESLEQLQSAQFFTVHNPVSPTSAHFDPPRYNPKNQILLLLSLSPLYSEENRLIEIKKISCSGKASSVGSQTLPNHMGQDTFQSLVWLHMIYLGPQAEVTAGIGTSAWQLWQSPTPGDCSCLPGKSPPLKPMHQTLSLPYSASG